MLGREGGKKEGGEREERGRGERKERERERRKVSLVSSFPMPPHFLVFKLISMEEERKSWHKGSCLVSSFSLGNKCWPLKSCSKGPGRNCIDVRFDLNSRAQRQKNASCMHHTAGVPFPYASLDFRR